MAVIIVTTPVDVPGVLLSAPVVPVVASVQIRPVLSVTTSPFNVPAVSMLTATATLPTILRWNGATWITVYNPGA